jgi:hypothetical protein
MILPDLFPDTPFDLPSFYDMMSCMRSLYIKKTGRGSALERYWGIVRLYTALTGGLLPLAPKSSGQPRRVYPLDPRGAVDVSSFL